MSVWPGAEPDYVFRPFVGRGPKDPEYPHQCWCGAEFRTQSSFLKHWKRKHDW